MVLQLVRVERVRIWPRAQLRAELEAAQSEHGQEAVEEALGRLKEEGLLGMSEEEAWASNAVRRLDELGLISV